MIDPNEFDDQTLRPLIGARSRLGRTRTGLDAARQDIAAMGRTLTEVTERLAKLDAAAESPAAVRRATLNDVLDVLREVGETSAYVAVRRMIREGY